ncbi:MAG: hypothetical protein KA365_01415 [Arenimonas sp.]|nr:hypothetical protein [Arenimonas sp.]
MNIITSSHFFKRTAFYAILVTTLLVSACSNEPENPADAIYFGGDILIVSGEQPQYAEALAVDDGKISFIGSKIEADKLAGKATKQVNLQGSALIPSVVSGVKQILTLQGVTSEPNCWNEKTTFKTSADLIAALKIAEVPRAKLGLGLFCLGYVPNTSNLNDVLTEAALDAAFPETSVILVEASLQNVVTNSVAKKKFSLNAYSALRKAIQKADSQGSGLQVGQSADFMIIDKNPLKDTSLSLASIKITQTIANGVPVLDAPKDLAMLAILDIFAAAADEKAALLKIDEMKAIDAAKAAESAEKAKKEAAKKMADSKIQAEAKAKKAATAKKSSAASPQTKTTATYTKGDRKVNEVEVAPPVAAATPKPPTARFNMTQDGKKMTAADFDAWMKAQGIRIVPAKPATAVPPVEPVKDN